MKRPFRSLAAVLTGVTVGLVLAEGLFWRRDRGAFPHLNVYVADADLGLRLRPGRSERLSAGKNPLTHVRINDRGYRGARWPAAGDDEVLVLGDSQVFGLGVEEDQTFASELGRRLGRTVLNAGVPTYGPPEFAQVAREIFRLRHPRTIVYVVNIANDLFEANRPNRQRHRVWDGWAVRQENAPATTRWFPGRELLYGRSHAVFALRRWFHTPVVAADQGTPSEGTHNDLLSTAARAEQAHLDAVAESKRLAEQHARTLDARQKAAASAEARVDQLVAEHVNPLVDPTSKLARAGTDTNALEKTAALFRAGRANPGDIVGNDSRPEGGRDITASVALIRQGVALRTAYENQLREKAEKDAALRDAVTQALSERDAQRAQLRDLGRTARKVIRPESPLQPALAAMKQFAEENQARLLVVVLPMDVQVSADEWAKYGHPAQDVTATQVLLDDVVRDSEALGAEALDVTAVLRKEEPGAFLDGDLHLTPKGHAAVAAAVAEQLAKKTFVPGALPKGGLPDGRSRAPSQREWSQTAIVWDQRSCHDGSREYKESENKDVLCSGPSVDESWDYACHIRRAREWFEVSCSPRIQALTLADLRLVSGGNGEAYTSMVASALRDLQLVTPLFPGDRVEADLKWNLGRQRLVLHWPADAIEPRFAMEPVVRELSAVHAPSSHEAAVCACEKEITPKTTSCTLRSLEDDEDCFRTYPSDCVGLLGCLDGRPEYAPSCLPGYGNAGARERCRPVCGANAPCPPSTGSCRPWQGGNVCL